MRKFTLFEKIVIPVITLIVAVVVPIYISNQEKKVVIFKMRKIQSNELSVLELVGKGLSNTKLEMAVDDRKVKAMYSNFVVLENLGNTPIRPEDFTKPITVSVNKPWKIYFQQPHATSGPIIEWGKIDDQSYKIIPTLFNPGENVMFFVYFIKFEGDEVLHTDKKEPEVNWAARIVNVKSIEFDESEKDLFVSNPYDKFIISHVNILFTTVNFQGYQVYLFVIISIGLFAASTYIARLSNRISGYTDIKDLALLCVIMFMSMSTAEIISYVSKLPSTKNDLWLGCYILLAFHVWLLGYIGYPLVKNKLINLQTK